jgi:hypothetical protein
MKRVKYPTNWGNVFVGAVIGLGMLVGLTQVLAKDYTPNTPIRGDVWLKLKDKGVEFNCDTDTQCFRDCMDLIDDADACERGLMEGGR